MRNPAKKLVACLSALLLLSTLWGCGVGSEVPAASVYGDEEESSSQSAPGSGPQRSRPAASSTREEEPPPPQESSSESASDAPPQEAVSQEAASQEVGSVPSQQEVSSELPAQSASPDAPLRTASTSVLVPSSPGTTVLGNDLAQIDASNASEGYITVRYLGGNSGKIKLQITKNTTYTYNLDPGGSYEVFPMSEGDGTYTVGVFENVGGTSYVTAMSEQVSVSLRDGSLPFLYPNQYVNFSSGSSTVQIGAQLASTAQTDLQVVEKVYNYTMEHITYDDAKANYFASGQGSGYVPAVDSVLAAGTGVCFDYAAVMTAMLRTQGIPTKLVVGYSGPIYHAWISTYLRESGWVNNIISFDGQNWKRMDPTFADNGNQDPSIMSYIENNANYNAMYVY